MELESVSAHMKTGTGALWIINPGVRRIGARPHVSGTVLRRPRACSVMSGAPGADPPTSS